MLIPASGCTTHKCIFEDCLTLRRKSGTQNVSTVILLSLAACPQCYCGEIRQTVTFHISLYCPKTYHGPDHLICIVE
jgi:hypothetical protein